MQEGKQTDETIANQPEQTEAIRAEPAEPERLYIVYNGGSSWVEAVREKEWVLVDVKRRVWLNYGGTWKWGRGNLTATRIQKDEPEPAVELKPPTGEETIDGPAAQQDEPAIAQPPTSEPAVDEPAVDNEASPESERPADQLAD